MYWTNAKEMQNLLHKFFSLKKTTFFAVCVTKCVHYYNFSMSSWNTELCPDEQGTVIKVTSSATITSFTKKQQ